MGASDYMVGNAPGGASYMAPNMSLQLMKGLGDLPDDYFQGTQKRRQLELQKPILDANGEPTTDFATIQRELLRRGGGEYAAQLLPYFMGQQMGNQISGQMRTLDQFATGQRQPAPLGQAGGPGNLQTPQQLQQPKQPQPLQSKLSSAGADSEGQENLASIASESGLDLERSGHLSAIASSMGVRLDEPLTPDQVQTARAMISRAAQMIRAGQ
ncbi:MAG TPA: hypothetical protein VFV12_08745, partial [Xanthobacteraceae bacterium]|nr:hypothetical protein [Xanthobacteraceae bacterium]